MRIFIVLLILVFIALGIWVIWFGDSTDITITTPTRTATPFMSVTASMSPTVTQTATPTRTATPLATRTPTPTGQGGEGPALIRQPVFVNVSATNGSQEHGIAAITANDNDLATVWFNLSGAPANVWQTAYIYHGPCRNLQNIAYALEPLMNGSSSTIINANFMDVAHSQNTLSVVVFRSNEPIEIQYPFACGEI